jgi:TetR/AcrR family transcriptional regulator, cholesterol catabolism regulator
MIWRIEVALNLIFGRISMIWFIIHRKFLTVHRRNSGPEKCFHSFGAEMTQQEGKDRILSAAYELFSRYGIKSVTMDDIAKHLSISKKTIYQYFRDKDEVVHTLLESRFQTDMADFETIASTAANVVEEVFAHMKKLHQMFTNANPNMFYDLRKHHPRSWDMVTRFRNETALGMVERALEKGKKDGYVRPDVNVSILSRLRIEEIEMGFNPQLFPPAQYPILDVQIAFVEHFLYGVCTLKGHKLINKIKEINEEE